MIEGCLVFPRRALQFVEEWPVDALDQEAAVLIRLEAVGDLNNLASGWVGIGIGRDCTYCSSFQRKRTKG